VRRPDRPERHGICRPAHAWCAQAVLLCIDWGLGTELRSDSASDPIALCMAEAGAGGTAQALSAALSHWMEEGRACFQALG
jgi:hypothetical protein